MCHHSSSSGRVFFVGAGPGADDLITVRGARRIAEADVVLWPAGAVPIEMVREHARPDAELVDCSRLPNDAVLGHYRAAAARRGAVTRLVPGDVALWAGLQQHIDVCRRLGLHVELVPGVSPLSAVVAATGRELAESSVLLAQLDGAPDQRLDTGGAVAVTASAARTDALAARLRAAGRGEDTPVVIGYRAGRPDELVVGTTLGELERTVKKHRLWLPALFLVGRSAAGVNGSRVPRVNGVRLDAAPTGSGAGPGSGAGSGAGSGTPLHRPYRRRRRHRGGVA